MTHPRIIEAEEANQCELCNKIAETRPYGPNGEEVCFQCGMKNPETTKRQFQTHVFGDGLPRRKRVLA